MAENLLADPCDGRVIASLVTSLVFHWQRLPIGLQTAIVSHASEIGFGHSDLFEHGDRRIIGFIRTHHQSVRHAAPERAWAPQRLWSAWLRQRRLVQDVDVELSHEAVGWVRRSWADRDPEPADRRRSVISEIGRGLGRARTALERCRARITLMTAGACR